jgi:hypothetical protein
LAGAALWPWAALAGRGSTRRSERRAVRSTPTWELRRLVRKRAMHRTGAPLVAGPWLEDEIGELLYWIPFLRWTQSMSPGLHERLFVVCRASSAAWYAGIGSGQAELERFAGPEAPAELGGGFEEDDLQGPLRDQVASAFNLGSRAFRVLPPDPVAATRSELANQNPAGRAERRLLDFAPLAPPPLPAGLELPEDFLAVRFEAEYPEVAAALAERWPVVKLDELDRSAQAAVLARARGFVGTYGVEAVLAVLLGVQAVAFSPGSQQVDEDELRLISSFLAAPPFGALHVIEAGGSADEAVEQASQLLDAPVEALATV